MVKSHRKKHKSGSSASHKTHENTGKNSNHKPTTKNNSNNNIWKITVIILGIVLILALLTSGFTNIPKLKNNSSELVDTVEEPLTIDLYVMSQCPYGVQAEDIIFEAVKNLGEDNFDLNVEYIVSPLGDGTFQSLHGQPEVDGNMVQLCAESVDETKFLDFILCMNEQAQLIPNNWETCANDLDYDVESIRTCFEGQEGIDLLTESAIISQEAQASASPTIFVNEKAYSGGREQIDFERAFCEAFGKEKPKSCADIPEPVSVELIVLNDKNCPNCDSSQIIAASEGLFPGVNIEELDINSKEGSKLVEKYDIELVPSYIFDEAVVETQSWKQDQFDQNFEILSDGKYKLKDLVTGASYYISEEKRLEKFSEMGINLEDDKPEIDFFVMSYCPYGNIAEEIIEEVYDVLGDSANFKPHYIYYANYQGGGSAYCMDEDSLYCSMHGVTEANQNVREQCVQEQEGIGAWFEFVREMNNKCTAQNADVCFESVANDLGYDLDAIKSCESEKALLFAEEDAKLMELFGARGSPAIYIDGATYSGDRDSNSILSAICSSFENAPSECNEVIDSNIGTAPAGSC